MMFPVQLTLLVAGAALALAAGSRVRSPAARPLLTPPPPSPPPADALAWVLDAAGPGPVGILALGGDDRWLRRLHSAAAAPALIWGSSGIDPNTTCPAGVPEHLPEWVGAVARFVITARVEDSCSSYPDGSALLASVLNTGKRKVYCDMCKGWLPQNLEFNSSAPVLLAVSGGGDGGSEAAARLLGLLWLSHQHFRSLLAWERASGRWEYYYGVSERAYFTPPVVHSSLASADSSPHQLPEKGLRELHNWRGRRPVGFGTLYPRVKDQIDFLSFSAEPWTAESQMMNDIFDRFGFQFGENFAVQYRKTSSVQFLNFITRGVGLSVERVQMTEDHLRAAAVLEGSAQILPMRVLVPRAPPLPAWSLPFRVFEPRLWALWAAAALGYALAWRRLTGQPLPASLAAALRAFSSCGGAPQDRVRGSAQRLQLAGALLASAVVVVSAYQGHMFTLMTEPDRYPEIDSLPQLAAARLHVRAPSQARMFVFANGSDEGWTPEDAAARRTLRRRMVQQTKPELLFEEKPGSPNYPVVLTDPELALAKAAFPGRLAESHVMRSQLAPALFAATVRRNFPWASIFNSYFLQLESSGFASQWEENMLRTIEVKSRYWKQDSHYIKSRYSSLKGDEDRRSVFEPPYDGPRVLTLDDLQSAFQLLVSGLLLTAAVFIGEILRARMPRGGRGRGPDQIRQQLGLPAAPRPSPRCRPKTSFAPHEGLTSVSPVPRRARPRSATLEHQPSTR